MLQIDHRESHDVDLFLGDPQILPFLNPTTQGYRLDRQPDGYEGDGAHVAKLIFDGIGEIDFICCGSITSKPVQQCEVSGRLVQLETPAEIVAKKIHYRGSRLQPRDMFDVAAVIHRCGEDYVVDALRACGTGRCAEALAVADAMDPAFASDLMRRLMLREHNRHLPSKAQSATRAVLRAALDL
ncbi:nucleotidyl transferase AbiEii/AbiGii toxin family protein [Methylobacterium nonmethylotrophicum]|uniref:Nucleotidyl transferase AbiEii toxin, Type IV TA system n=1 Tax=Methylobacterium nonmethylotrophicum TaxID=1141884 RepID=A0A4Z0NLK7_9HYPH|nr:nucleotidyl transferase AbiEii/AbiGii toxin family protein [Methylobacterium nonmethylotrophicum]TGD97364.1 hypothetical protein EU555_19530 [Methylobacterium nonmethylotrophicum]